VSIVVDDRREFRGHIPGIAQMAQAARWSAFLIAEEHSTSSSQQTVGTATDDPPSLKLPAFVAEGYFGGVGTEDRARSFDGLRTGHEHDALGLPHAARGGTPKRMKTAA